MLRRSREILPYFRAEAYCYRLGVTSSPALTTCLRLLRAQATLVRRFEGPLGSLHGLSLPDLQLLLLLEAEPEGRLRRVDLAERLSMSQSSMTRMLGPLERVGLVERSADPGDARAVYASLTPSGRTRVLEARTTAERVAGTAFEGWSEETVAFVGGALEPLAAAGESR
jgi:DNA-binding MarR family transcriptional regulator